MNNKILSNDELLKILFSGYGKENLKQMLFPHLVNFVKKEMDESIDTFIRNVVLPELEIQAANKDLTVCKYEHQFEGTTAEHLFSSNVSFDYRVNRYFEYELGDEVFRTITKGKKIVLLRDAEHSAIQWEVYIKKFAIPLEEIIKKLEEQGISCKENKPFDYTFSVDLSNIDALKYDENSLISQIVEIRKKALNNEKITMKEIYDKVDQESDKRREQRKKEITSTFTDYVKKFVLLDIDRFIHAFLKATLNNPGHVFEQFVNYVKSADKLEYSFEGIFSNKNVIEFVGDEVSEALMSTYNDLIDISMTGLFPLSIFCEKLKENSINCEIIQERDRNGIPFNSYKIKITLDRNLSRRRYK